MPMRASHPVHAFLWIFLVALLGAAFLPSAAMLSADEPPPGAHPGDQPPGGQPGQPASGADGEDPDAFDSPTTFTPDQAGKAIDRGLSWLKTKQNKNGGYGDLTGAQNARSYQGDDGKTHATYGFAPGLTSLVIYTFLKCHVSLKDPAVSRAFDYIKKEKEDDPKSSYANAMLLLAVCATADTSKSTKASEKVKPTLSGPYRGWAQKLVDDLLKQREETHTKVWRYQNGDDHGGPAPGGDEDLSSTQLAALALFAAHRCGVKVKPDVWEDILKFSLNQQDEDGPLVTEKDPRTGKTEDHKARGFSYIRSYKDNAGESHPSSGMTACGVANLMMCRFVLTDGGRKKDAWESRPDAKKVQDAVYDGLAWLQSNWEGYTNVHPSHQPVYTHYWHYALERAMDLVGNQKLGERFWYSDIGQELINRQDAKGFWRSGSTPYDPNDVLDTCFSLLFLRRATKGTIPFPSITGGSEDPPVDNR
jgi:hypothetical protein